MQNQLKNIRSLSVEYCNEYSENKKNSHEQNVFYF